MPKNVPPLFLARRAYRRRRMMDGARLLPLLGAVLVMIPALWQPEQTAAPDTARGAVYIFGVWAALILAALMMSRGLSAAMTEEDEDAGGTGPSDVTGSYLDQPMRGGQQGNRRAAPSPGEGAH